MHEHVACVRGDELRRMTTCPPLRSLRCMSCILYACHRRGQVETRRTAALVFPVVGILTRATGAGRGGCRCPQSRAEAGRAIAEGAGPPLAAPDGLVVAVRPTRACDWLLKWARAADVPLLTRLWHENISLLVFHCSRSFLLPAGLCQAGWGPLVYSDCKLRFVRIC